MPTAPDVPTVLRTSRSPLVGSTRQLAVLAEHLAEVRRPKRTRCAAVVLLPGAPVIGADGLRSLVARSVQAPTYNARPALACAYYTYWSDVPLQGVELYPRPGRMVISGPTNDGQVILIIY